MPDAEGRPIPRQSGPQELHQDHGTAPAGVLDAALAYAARGWPVFPIKPGDKVPATRNGFKDATTDPEQIRAWWERIPDANIGIPTGVTSGLVVVDVDNGPAGETSLAKLEAQLGQLPPTFTIRTPGDQAKGKAPGRQLYLHHPGGKVKNSAGKLGVHLDVRGDGGYVVAPPSLRPDGPYVVEHNGQPQPIAGPWLQHLQNGKAPTNDDEHLDQTPALFDKPARSFTRDQARQYVNEHALGPLQNAPEGSRNTALNNAALVLGHFIPAFLTQDQVVATLTACARHIGLDEDEIGPTIASGLAAGMADPYELAEDQALDLVTPPRSRRVNLRPYLDGTYTPPEPSIGAERADGVRILYPAKWHTVIGLTGCGKSWLACWHAAHELEQGNTVVYLHFEEAGPAPTLARFRALGVTDDTLDSRLVWLDADEPWTAKAFEAELEELDPAPTLVVLDGINAACTLHGWPHEKPEGVGAYRETFVRPATKRGATVLSLGHPVKDRTRQTERHGYGSGDWLNLVDGVGFRLEASGQPIRRGGTGASRLYSVKDRAGGVERYGTLNGAREAGWWFLGMFQLSTMIGVDQDGAVEMLSAKLLAPAKELGQDTDRHELDDLGDAIVATLEKHGRQYASKTRLAEMLRADAVDFSNDDLGPALDRLQALGRLLRGPEPARGKSWPGSLPFPDPDRSETGTDPEAGS